MKKLILISLFLSVFILSGCSHKELEKESSLEDGQKAIDDLILRLDIEEESRLAPICEQSHIPSEYAKDCYFRTLNYCKENSGQKILKEDLEKCLPVFLREEMAEVKNSYY